MIYDAPLLKQPSQFINFRHTTAALELKQAIFASNPNIYTLPWCASASLRSIANKDNAFIPVVRSRQQYYQYYQLVYLVLVVVVVSCTSTSTSNSNVQATNVHAFCPIPSLAACPRNRGLLSLEFTVMNITKQGPLHLRHIYGDFQLGFTAINLCAGGTSRTLGLPRLERNYHDIKINLTLQNLSVFTPRQCQRTTICIVDHDLLLYLILTFSQSCLFGSIGQQDTHADTLGSAEIAMYGTDTGSLVVVRSMPVGRHQAGVREQATQVVPGSSTQYGSTQLLVATTVVRQCVRQLVRHAVISSQQLLSISSQW